MIKTVLLDLDDTILDFKMSERIALTKTLNEFGIEADDYIISQYSKYNLSQWKRLEKGEITRQQVKVNRYKLLFDEMGIDLSPEKATAVYEKNLAVGHYFIDGAVDMLKSLCKKYDLYIVSNGSKTVQEGRLSTADIYKYVKGIFISEAVGCEKPHKEFFNYCFERISNFNKNEAVIIGDSLSSDIKGGKNAGIKTIWFNPDFAENNTDIIPDFEMHSPSEALDIISNI